MVCTYQYLNYERDFKGTVITLITLNSWCCRFWFIKKSLATYGTATSLLQAALFLEFADWHFLVSELQQKSFCWQGSQQSFMRKSVIGWSCNKEIREKKITLGEWFRVNSKSWTIIISADPQLYIRKQSPSRDTNNPGTRVMLRN